VFQPLQYNLPSWFAKNGYRDVNDLQNNPTLSLTGSNFFEFLGQNSQWEADFAAALKIQDSMPPKVMPQFPFAEALDSFKAESASTGGSDVFLVDIGGGKGQYLERLINTHPDLPGRKILQDLQSVIESIDKSAVSFEPIVYDFFMPQPVKGAKYYHYRSIFHDWPDKECLEMLEQLKVEGAFKPGYSKLLVQTIVIPEQGYHERDAMLDINMLVLCGTERNESQWRELLDKAGFKIVKIVKAEAGSYAMIECDLATT
jgi:O-methyltransferase domain